MMELREKIQVAIADGLDGHHLSEWMVRSRRLKLADAILAIPEIRDALSYRNAVLASRLPDLPPDRVGYLIGNLANRLDD
jgi:hypothetical protein